MNITFQRQGVKADSISVNHTERTEIEKPRPSREKTMAKGADAVNVSFFAGDTGPDMFGVAGSEKEGHDKAKTLAQLQQEASYTDVGVSQDYMTLMSHTMSEEDYRELSKEGFHFDSLDPDEAVTIVDKIKAELVRSGKHIVGYTDDLDLETLAAAVGSDTLARALADSFREADIPLTRENITSVEKAWNMASGLSAPAEGTYQYMVANEMEPELWNFYVAENSGADSTSRNPNALRAKPEFLEDEKIQAQIDKVLEQAGYETNEKNRQSAQWLLERNLPLTVESIRCLKNLQDAAVPVTEEAFAAVAARALAEGKDPVYADLSAGSNAAGNIYTKAVEILEFYTAQYESQEVFDKDADEVRKWLGQQGDLTARKQLEEVRLRMTAEVNVKLLKSGFAIETAPMEQLIEALREAEKAVADRYFPGDDQSVAKYENWNETTHVIRDMPHLPAQLLGTVRIGAADGENATLLEHFYSEGVELRQTYARAGESYEALMTAPRADLGDSMRKAFGNVEELVRGLGLEPTEEICRAVRILGYNHMEITQENIRRVREADEQVQRLMEKMTPGATLKMIRDGINPLEKSFAELNSYFDSLPESYREASESYSRYLYGLEQNHQITQEERETYIGVYRLMRQIERRDGAAIGAVINTRAELQFSNLLSAVRSGNFRHMDVRATDELGVLRELVKEGEELSISEQIQRSYAKDSLVQMRRLTALEGNAAAMLERGEMPVTAQNLLAAQELTEDFSNPFRTLRDKAQKLRGENQEKGDVHADSLLPDTGEDLWEKLSERDAFREEYDKLLAGMQEEAETLTLDHARESIDVKALQMAHIQLGIMGGLAHNEEYVLSMYVGEELAAVHLTLERKGTVKGGISIEVNMGDDTHMEAHLQVKNNRVEGFLLGKTSEEVRKLQNASDIFYNLINENASMNLEAVKLPVVSRGNINMTGMSESNSQGEEASPENGTLYHVAKLFLQAIR